MTVPFQMNSLFDLFMDMGPLCLSLQLSLQPQLQSFSSVSSQPGSPVQSVWRELCLANLHSKQAAVVLMSPTFVLWLIDVCIFLSYVQFMTFHYVLCTGSTHLSNTFVLRCCEIFLFLGVYFNLRMTDQRIFTLLSYSS